MALELINELVKKKVCDDSPIHFQRQVFKDFLDLFYTNSIVFVAVPLVVKVVFNLLLKLRVHVLVVIEILYQPKKFIQLIAVVEVQVHLLDSCEILVK